MKNKIFPVLLALLIFSIFPLKSFSQLRLVLGPNIGLTQPTVDYSGETTDFYSGTKYGLRSGINYGVVAKLTFGPLNGKLSVSYASLSNTGKGDINNSSSTLEINNNIFMLTLGTEFGFAIPFSPIRPYAGVDVLFSTISGSFKSSIINGNNENSIQSSSRTGLGFNFGSEFKLSNAMSLDLSLHYNLLNLFGKEYKSNGNTRLDSYTNVNDAADPVFHAGDSNHFIGNDRTIATIQIQFGLLFGF